MTLPQSLLDDTGPASFSVLLLALDSQTSRSVIKHFLLCSKSQSNEAFKRLVYLSLPTDARTLKDSSQGAPSGEALSPQIKRHPFQSTGPSGVTSTRNITPNCSSIINKNTPTVFFFLHLTAISSLLFCPFSCQHTPRLILSGKKSPIINRHPLFNTVSIQHSVCCTT